MAVNPQTDAQLDAAQRLYDELPVSAQSIRLLRVHAGDESSTGDTPIRCELSVAHLTTNPVYAALSYVWGDPSTPPDHVFCNGVPIPVTSNCYQALQHLRAINGSFVVWIDAVCINQHDPSDKERQIGLMGEIYSRARTTYVWLGTASEATDQAIGYLGNAGFLDFYFVDGDIHGPALPTPRVLGALWSYAKGRWALQSNTIPHEATSDAPYLPRQRRC